MGQSDSWDTSAGARPPDVVRSDLRERVGDVLGLGTRVDTDVPQDRGASVAHRVVGDWPVEQVPGSGGGLELEGAFGFVHVATGDVQDAVSLSPGPLEYEGDVRGTRNAVGPGDLGQEVFRAALRTWWTRTTAMP